MSKKNRRNAENRYTKPEEKPIQTPSEPVSDFLATKTEILESTESKEVKDEDLNSSQNEIMEKNENEEIKSTEKKVESVSNYVNDEAALTINLQPYLIPISIIVGSIIISLSIFLSIKGANLFSGSVNGANTVVAPTAAVATPAAEQNPAAKTTLTGAPYIGNKETAKIAIVEFSDYECPFCKRHHEQVYPDIVKNLIDTGKAIYAYRNYIAVPSHNPAATTEAYAASCVLELSGNNFTKFFEYGKALYTNTQANGGGLAGNGIYDQATTLGIDATALKTCVDSGKYKDLIASDQKLAEEAGIQGTPGFVVGKIGADGTVDGKIIAGAYPYTEFERLVNELSQ